MTPLRILLAKLRATARRGRDDEELVGELATHLDLLADDLERQGLPPQEARRRARIRLGGSGQIVEATRDQRRVPWLEEIARDVRLAVRSLRRAPIFAATAVLSLAVGVGANTIGFSFLYGYLIRPLPFADGARLVSVIASAPSRGLDRWGVTLHEVEAIRQRTNSFDWVAASAPATMDLTGTGEPRRLNVSVVSPGLHRSIGIQPVAGRLFREGDDRGVDGPLALIAEGLWRSAFAADRTVVGRAITLDGRSHTIVGVVPATPSWAPFADVCVPIGRDLWETAAGDRRFRLVARLADDASIASADRDLEALSASLERAAPGENAGVHLFAEDLRRDLLNDDGEPALVLYGVVTLLLLLASANAATLLVMRSAARSREFGIRASLGAGRIQVLRQVIVEHAVVTVAGGACGALAGIWMLDLVPESLVPSAGVFTFNLDAHGGAMLAGIVLASGLGFGAISAWSVSRQAFAAPHILSRGAASSRDRARLRAGLAIFEVAAAVLVLIGTGLMLKGAIRVAAAPPGFEADGLLTMEVNLPDGGSPDPARATRFFRALVERVAALPHVESVSAGNPPPHVGWNVAYEAEGTTVLPDGQRPRTIDAVVMPGYFRTLRIPLLDGRDFTPRDADPDAAPAIIVSQAFARATWPGQRAVGRRVRLIRREQEHQPWREVVGVVGNTRTSTFAPERGWVYLPHGQPAFSELILMIRARGDVAPVVRDVQNLVWEADPALPLHWNRMLADLIAERYWQPRVFPPVFAVFASLALAVALVGVYGVVAFASARRVREFGIRLAVGSPPAAIWRIVLGQGLRLAVAGTGIGMIGALLVMRLASAVFFGVSPTDGAVYAVCASVAVGVVLLASAAPAFRAARIDPVAVLRCE